MLLIGTQKRLSENCEKPLQTTPSYRNLLIRFHNNCPRVTQISSTCHSARWEIRDGHMYTSESSQFECHFDSFCHDALALLVFQLPLALHTLFYFESHRTLLNEHNVRRKWCDWSLLRSQPFYMNTEDWLKYVSLAHWFLSPGGHNHLFNMRVKKEREKIIYGRIPCNGLTYISVNYKYRLFLFIYVPYIWCIEKKYMWAHHKEKMYTGEFLKLWDEMKFLLFTKSREWGKRATC